MLLQLDQLLLDALLELPEELTELDEGDDEELPDEEDGDELLVPSELLPEELEELLDDELALLTLEGLDDGLLPEETNDWLLLEEDDGELLLEEDWLDKDELLVDTLLPLLDWLLGESDDAKLWLDQLLLDSLDVLTEELLEWELVLDDELLFDILLVLLLDEDIDELDTSLTDRLDGLELLVTLLLELLLLEPLVDMLLLEVLSYTSFDRQST